MENVVKVFENAEFGQIRTVEIDGEPWLVGKDVAMALGYERSSKAVVDHTEEEDRKMLDGKTQSCFGIELGQRGGWLINESGLYTLILGSKIPSAKRFKHWVTSEVLPSIRKTGAYQIKEAPNVLANLPVAKAIADVRTALDEAKKLFKASDGMLLATAMATVSEVHKVNLKPFERLLPPATKAVAQMNATELAQRAGFLTKTGKANAMAVNKKLEEMGYQTRQGKNWRLTEAGREYGEEMAYVNNGHSGYRILWSIEVLPKLTSPEEAELKRLKELLMSNYDAALMARNFLKTHGGKMFAQLSLDERAEFKSELEHLTEVQVQ